MKRVIKYGRLPIDRVTPLNLKEDWHIETEDEISPSLREIDLDTIFFTSCLKPGELWITGEEKLKRHAKGKHILPDAKIGRAFLNEKVRKALENLCEEKGIEYVDILGTIFCSLKGYRYYLYLYKNHGVWNLEYNRLDSPGYVGRFSLVLARK